MAHRGQWLIERSLKHAYLLEDWTPPATLYLAWFTGAVSEAGIGPEVSTTGTGYARTAVTNGTTNFEWVAPDLIRTKIDISSGPPVGSNWGTLTWAALYTAISGTNYLWVAGQLEQPVVTAVGAPIVLPAGTGFRHYGRQQA